MQDPDIVRGHIFPNANIPVMKGVDRHEASWIQTELCIICALGHVSLSVRTAEDERHPCWNYRPPLQDVQFSPNTHTLIEDECACGFHTARGVVCIIPKRVPSGVVAVLANVGDFVQHDHAPGAGVSPQASDSPQSGPG